MKYDFAARGITLERDEIFISDGAKSDTGSIGDIFSPECKVAVCDPVYPVYIDTNIMAGRGGKPLENGRFSNIAYLDCTAENGFIPPLPEQNVDIIYLCSPNNPTGTAMNKEQLQQWVDWANEHGSVILFDAAYEAFITESNIPHSIFELDGAKKCAIEFRSFQRLRALPAFAAHIRLYRASSHAAESASTRCGRAGRRRGSTACHI